jgi:hypothetical protein
MSVGSTGIGHIAEIQITLSGLLAIKSGGGHGPRSLTEVYTRGLPLVPTSARLKLLHACDQWQSSPVFTPLTVTTVNCVQTRKARGLPVGPADRRFRPWQHGARF